MTPGPLSWYHRREMDTSTQPTTNGRRVGSSRITLMARHREILRLTLLGWSALRIAAQIGISVMAVRAVIRSPLAQAELERMQEEADRLTVNTPLRAAMESELNGATIESVRLSRRLLNDSSVDARVRTGIAKHFMDRVLFDVDESGDKTSGYREILRRLDDVDKQLGRGVWLVPGAATVEAGHGASGTPPVNVSHASDSTPDPLNDAIRRNISGAGIVPD